MKKYIENYDNRYIIYSDGKIFSVISNKFLKLRIDKNGYNDVLLSLNGKHKRHKVHRLVAEAFIPNPLKLPQVNHKNEDKTDNRVENLEFCDAKYNINYGTRNERSSKTKTGKSLSEETKDKLSIAFSGENNPMYNRTHTKEAREKISNAHSKKVAKLDENGNIVSVFKSLQEIKQQFGFNPTSISNCCRGIYKNSYGYKWKYLE